ncbi:MAG: glycosyltransferase family 2 protein [Lachnospiraceae bacterium]|nr:glycosyltransferase family 2 protein [Lachnospiraceae bacterium]
MITISLCMIVKNEEKVLDRCLGPLAPLMDEIIIVDTGSTDRTKEIASKYTHLIYDYQWTGNFSDARNFSFSKATKEYIYCADADEVLDSVNIQKFKILKMGLLPEIEIVQMYYCNQLAFNTIYNFDKELRPKLYKRVRQFKWVNPIHEAVRLEPVIYDSDIEIIHRPESLHASRDLESFRKMYRDNMRLTKRLHNIYAKELFIAGEKKDFLEAIAFFSESVMDTSRDSDEILEACCVLAHAYRISGDVVSFYKYALKNVISESCSEICYELGCFYEAQKDYDEAIIWFYNAAFETKPILNLHCGGDYPLAKLSDCYQKLDELDIAKDYARQAREWHSANKS